MVKSWLEGVDESPNFSLANLPFGIITVAFASEPRVAVAVGTWVLDLKQLSTFSGFEDVFSCLEGHFHVFSQPTLNAFAALGRPVHRQVRAALQDVLSEDTSFPDFLKSRDRTGSGDPAERWSRTALVSSEDVEMHLPMEIGDYTDFYAGYHHAYQVGVMFRGPENALQPNYTHLPVGYHGRASTIVPSGTKIERPVGQVLDATVEPKQVVTRPTRELDFELELGCLIGTGSAMGSPTTVEDAENHIFGYVLLNDWSARDIQRWEYVPLGPFNGKNFATTISAWVVLADALESFRVPALENKTPLQDYLVEQRKDSVFDIQLSVDITPQNGTTSTVSTVSSRHLLWSFSQMIAHHTIGGCQLRTGDLFGSGTISGPGAGEKGSLLELSEGGKKRFHLGEEEANSSRTFLEPQDTVAFRGSCGEGVGFGDCVGTIS